MLPKVSAALSKFVAPIQTTSAGSSAHEKEFVRAQPERKAKVLHLKGQKPKDEVQPGPESQPEPLVTPGTRRDLGSSFLQLFASLRQNSGAIFKRIGLHGYRLGIKATRRSGRLRKGAMLDVKIE